MKKRAIMLAVGLLILVLGTIGLYRYLAAQGETGYVIIGIGRWVLETSLFVMAAVLVLTFVAFYLLIWGTLKTTRLPRAFKRRGEEQRIKRSQEALIAGLIESAEGNWEKAERHLIRHAADSGVPLINYLTAARVAHSRGAHEQRDEYLKLARERVPEAELAVGLTRAELQLSNKQFAEALDSLTELNRVAPNHAAVLRLMHQAYAQLEDWEALRRLIPALHSNKVLMEAEIRLLETETYSALLRQKAETKNATALREAWSHVPEHIKSGTGLKALYCAAMIEAGAGEEIEDALRHALSFDWNETLLVLYGCIPMADAAQHLARAELWLGPHPDDALLLRVLGSLALRAGKADKARQYLERSIEIEPSMEAYRLMGDLLYSQNDYVAASTFYRNGMMFASREAVAQIEQDPRGEHVAPDVGEPAAVSG